MLPNPTISLLGLELGSLWVCLVGGPSLLGVDLRSWMLVGAAAYTQMQDAQRCFDGHGASSEAPSNAAAYTYPLGSKVSEGRHIEG